MPDAQKQKLSCLTDLTTASTVATGHTNPNDWAGLNATGTRNPSGIPGIQVDGYFPDTSTSNTNNGWNHDAQFVIRLPDRWNGKLVVSGAPGTRTQYAGDFLFSDWVLSKGYAYAMTDKGNNGGSFQRDGATPGDAVAEWNRRVTQLTKATKAVVRQTYRQAPRRTYLFGISNGGYLTRWQLENRPWLYDGGIDWEGTLFRAAGPNLLTYLPTALREYPKYRAGDEAAHRRMLAAGFAPGSEFTWEYHYGVYWDLTQRLYREEFDPSYDGALDAGIPFCPSGTPSCDADYDYSKRPGRAERHAEGPADRRPAPADAHPPRHPGRAAADRHGLGRLPPDDQAPGPRQPAPLLPDRRRHPRRRPQRHLRRSRPTDPPLRPQRLHPDDLMGRAPPAAAAEPDDPATRGRLGHGEHMRAAGRSDRSDSAPRRCPAMVSFRVTSITLRRVG